MRVVGLLLGIALACAAPTELKAGIPLYVSDAHFGFVNSWGPPPTLSPDHRADVELINEHAVVYMENGGFDSDAPYFDDSLTRTPHAIMRYVGYGNLRYSGSAVWIDVDRRANTIESNFYHATDPATLTAWRLADGSVRLHWTPDLRHVRFDGMLAMYSGSPLPDQQRVQQYVIVRHEAAGSVEIPWPPAGDPRSPWDGVTFDDPNYFSFVDPAGAQALSYSILSVPPGPGGPAPLPFSADAVVPEPAGQPHFWAIKQNYQEAHYAAESTGPLTWNLIFHVDQPLPEATPNLVIRRFKRISRTGPAGQINETSVYEDLPASYEPATGRIMSGLVTRVNRGQETDWQTDWYIWGGVAYHLIYTPTSGPAITYPAPINRDGAGRTRCLWTSINNRTLGCSWPNYMMNCESASWTETVRRMCVRLGSGAAVHPSSGGNAATYTRILLDCALAINSDHHNRVKPFEAASDVTARAATIAQADALCRAVDADPGLLGSCDLVFNTPDLWFVDAFTTPSGAVPGFGGVMDENFPFDDFGIKRLADMARRFRAYDYPHNIVKVDGSFGVEPEYGDRTQAVSAFLMATPIPHDPLVEPAVTFGYAEWNGTANTQVPIFPEQMIRTLGWAGGIDPFANVSWPAIENWNVTNNTNATTFLRSQGTIVRQTSDGDIYAVAGRELDDGLPQTNEVYAIWDLTLRPPEVQGTFTLAELFPDKPLGSWYRMVLDGETLSRGGVLSSEFVGSQTPLLTQELMTTLFFTAPVASPVVQATSVSPIPATAGVTKVLKIAASHWNGQPLSLKGRGADLGWPDEFTFAGPDANGVYTYSGPTGGLSEGQVYSVPVVATGTDGLMTFTIVAVQAVPTIVIDDEAVYPVLTNSHDGKIALSARIDAFVPLQSVTVTAAALGVAGAATLLDDGSGEDVAPGDGIFTSARVSATATVAGYYSGLVVVQPEVGSPVQQSIAIRAVSSDVEFAPVPLSANVAPLYDALTEQPYSAISFNTHVDGVSGLDAFVVTFDSSGKRAVLRQRSRTQTNEIKFEDPHWLVPDTELPTATRGAAYGDVNGDRLVDFVLCGAQGARVFVNSGTAQLPQFVDATATVFAGIAPPVLSGAVAAAWADYDLDGDLDLMVSACDHTGPISEVEQLPDARFTLNVLRNDGHGHLASAFACTTSVGGAGLAGLWAHLSGSARPYLVTPWVEGGSYLASFQPTRIDGTNEWTVVPAPSLIEGAVLGDLSSVTVMEYDHDPAGLPDLLVIDRSGAGQAVILQNTYSAANGRRFVAHVLDSGRHWSGAVVQDFDSDGQDDVLLLPKTGLPALYVAYTIGSVLEPPTFREVAFASGLRAGATGGGIAGDWSGSVLPDLFLGRSTSAGQVLYDNVGSSTSDWIDVFPATVGNSNESLVGSKVVVQRGGHTWTKRIDGGSGRGGQGGSGLRFYLGETTGPVAVAVEYPSGDADQEPNAALGTAYAPVEDTPIILKTGTKADPDPTFTYELGPGTIDWVFRWRTVGIKGDVRQDAVTIEDHGGYDSTDPCYLGIEPGTPRVLRWGDPGVTIGVYRDGNDWRHELRWTALPCAPGCQYKFKVTSGLGNGVTSTGPAKVFTSTGFCLPDPDPNQQ